MHSNESGKGSDKDVNGNSGGGRDWLDGPASSAKHSRSVSWGVCENVVLLTLSAIANYCSVLETEKLTNKFTSCTALTNTETWKIQWQSLCCKRM
jgi:hypothetical protein